MWLCLFLSVFPSSLTQNIEFSPHSYFHWMLCQWPFAHSQHHTSTLITIFQQDFWKTALNTQTAIINAKLFMQTTQKANKCFGCYINQFFLIADWHKFYCLFSLFYKPHGEWISVNSFYTAPLWSRLPKYSCHYLIGSSSIPRASVQKTGKFDQFFPPSCIQEYALDRTEVYCINLVCSSLGRFGTLLL